MRPLAFCSPLLAGSLTLSCVVFASACQPKKTAASGAPQSASPEESAREALKEQRPALSTQSEIGKEVLATMDTGADPCQDFYRYACGGWLDRTELPSDKPRYGRGFGVVRDRNTAALRGILEASIKEKGERAKIGRFYAACMDESAVDSQGIQGLMGPLAEIDKLKRPKDIMTFLGKHLGRSIPSALFDISVSNDFKDPDLYILSAGQDGLGLGERGYYLEERHKPVLDAYREHVRRMLEKLKLSPEQATQGAQKVIAFEQALAKISKARDQLRDPQKLYHPMSAKAFEALAPKLYLKDFLRAAGYNKINSVNVYVPDYFKALPDLLAKSDIEAIKTYLKFQLISGNAALLSKDIIDTNFIFTSKLTGTKALLPRWERCVGATTATFPDLVAQAYVEARFPGESKAIALTMIKDVERAFESKLVDLKWMDPATRTGAVAKMKAIGNKVGYPDKWRKYDGLDAKKGYFDNAMAARNFEYKRQQKKLGQRVDEAEWFIPASMVNAFYSPLQNEIVFPAGILQPPYFSRDFPRAMNYGAMGMVMGHELSHGFDDSGRKFDGKGIMQEWWDPSAAQRFERQAQCIEKAFSEIEIQPGVNINGKLTLGENIADFGGIKYAYYGYKEWTKSHGEEAPIIKGLSNEQLLFVAFAQGWCSKSSPEYDRRAIMMDPHSPPKERVNLPLAHFPEFAQAFSCGEGTPMRPKQLCEVW